MNEVPNLKNKVLIGGIWKLSENFLAQFISFIIQIVLARLLMPSDFGIIAIISIFITLANVFFESGFTSALIQKNNVSQVEYSSVFWLNLIVALVLYILLFFSAPLISNFYNIAELNIYLKIQGVVILISSLGAVQNAILFKNFAFKQSFYRKFVAIIIQGFVGIILAYKGFGVWALIISNISSAIVATMVLWVAIDWKPSMKISKKSIMNLFGFGYRMLFISLLNAFFQQIQSIIIGKLDTITLGYYNRGQSIPNLISVNVDGAINALLFPTLSTFQNDVIKLKDVLRQALKMSMFLMSPILVGLCVTAKPLVIILLSEKWLQSVPYMQISCLICLSWPLSARSNAINAIGRNDITLKLNLFVKFMTLIFIVIFINKGALWILIATAIASYIGTFINFLPCQKFLSYTLKEQFKDILPPVFLSIVMGLLCFSILLLNLNVWLTLILQIVIGIGFYTLGSRLLKLESYFYIVETIKGLIQSRK